MGYKVRREPIWSSYMRTLRAYMSRLLALCEGDQGSPVERPSDVETEISFDFTYSSFGNMEVIQHEERSQVLEIHRPNRASYECACTLEATNVSQHRPFIQIQDVPLTAR